MRSTCHIVLLATLASGALPGCYLFHTVEGEPGPLPVLDGGPRPPGARDAGDPPHDAGRIPPRDAGPLACPAARPDVTCLESIVAPPGRAFSLPYAFDACGCCVETTCSARADHGSRTITLRTTLCPDPCDCAACVTPRGTCELPALERGTWSVIVNGSPAFELLVEEDSGLVPPPPGCVTYAEIDACAPLSDPLPGTPWSPGSACVGPRLSTGTLDVIEVHHDCWGCGDVQGPCIATLEERLTTDLPPGGDLRITPTQYPTACDVDCPAICTETTRSCAVPPLRPGDFYRVFVGESSVGSFVAGDATSICAPSAG